MSNVFIEESTLTNIGNAIREKTGKTDLILPRDMPSEIAEISSGSEVVLQDKTIKENGVYTADEGYDGLGEVNVDMPSVTSTVTAVKVVPKTASVSNTIDGNITSTVTAVKEETETTEE